MSIADLAAAGRRAEERLMIDSCVISGDGAKTFNEATGKYTEGSGATEYSGKCRVKLNLPIERQAGERTNQIIRPELRIPRTVTTAFSDRAKVTVTSQNPSTTRSFRIVSETTGTTASSRRFILEDWG